ncbi:hypothetical protein F4804DRAFT_185593 [Jackrogersella minutella]|nr:hypothetical protein F4804DRAFT_185593 [Jackrogersella minutella]
MSSVGTTPSAIAVGFSFPVINGIIICLRFYTRRKLKTERQLDDWLCIPAWLCLTGSCAALLTGVYTGAFTGASSADQEHVLAQVTAALVVLWIGANFLVKLIILCFYRHIFVGRVFNLCNWALIGLSVVWIVYAIISWLFYCGTDLEANFEGSWLACPAWGFEIQVGVFAMDSFIDFALLILPIPFVWRLHLDLKRKMVVIIIFILGGFAFVVGLINTIIQLVTLTQPELAASGGGANFFEGSSLLPFYNWPTIEIGVGLLASNLPHLSFRLGRVMRQSLPRALRVSLDTLRNAAAALSLSPGRHHSYDQGSTRRSGEEGRGGTAESQQGLYRKLTEAEGARSLEQNSCWSAEVIELHDVGASRTKDDAV